MMEKISGNQLFVKALIEEGVDTLFAYPGGYAIDIFDELYQMDHNIEIVLPRHEQGLIHEADGYARSTGKVGVCLVTSGPGATNLVTGIATANYDSVPLVCFTGQVNLPLIGNDAFQEVDIVGCTRNIAKFVITVRNREDLGRIIKEAFFIARTGKPGVVLVDLPKDIMAELGSAEYPKEVNIRGYKPQKKVHIGQLHRAMGILEKAERPLFLIGGGTKIAKAHKEMRELAELTGVPVVSTIMGMGVMPTDHPLFIGNAGMHGRYAANMAISECDVLFSIGTRFSDRITGKLGKFAPKAKIIHIDIDTAAIYMNEIEVGQAIKECEIPREELFITTKLWVQDAGYEKAKLAIDAALKRLQLDYVDLLLIHEPMGDIYGMWKAMEEAYHESKIRALGVSNMYADRLMDFIMHVEIQPVINQIRTNPYFQHQDTNAFMKQYQIIHEACI